ncbi:MULTISPECIES: L,D-transpeptidase family protein [unclassified Sphingomonas]|jgi:L,D-transpeptidase YcbB|uniref:L,D-transpeptidase family protein n=1 Tax=unclassified Sphingomonas TaxID=196159 RepID=UPI0018E52D91|nr:L,D-transpeptidase family protein [Sphingomonas sp. FARSPH]
MIASPFPVSARRAARLIAALAGGSLVAGPLAAQVASSGTPMPQARVAPPAVVQTVTPPAATAAALPTLSVEQARQLATLIARAEVAQGLRQGPARDLSTLSPAALARVALDYAHAVHVGRLDTADFIKDWGIRPQPYDPLPGFSEAVRQDRLAAWVAALPPPYAGYDALVKGLARYRDITAAGGWGSLPANASIPFQSSGPLVTQLRKRLAMEDPAVSTTGATFDDALLAAVRRAQRRYGLNPVGTVGVQTIAMLNVPVGQRTRQIMANLERWRWLPTQLAAKRVQVNIAAAVLTVFDGDNPVLSMKAVTGRPGNETPMLVSEIHSIVINPPWNVPSSIANKELWPKERANPGYLKRNGFRVIDAGNGEKRLQQSSEKSALGRFKFDFPNDFAVYLHDTPAQSGFSRFDRLASHGCVRLEKPADLAALMLKTTPEWQPAAVDAALASGKTVRAAMAEPVAVYLMYWTAFAGSDGQVGFREDPYGWDSLLAGKIEARSAERAAATQQ